MDIAAMPDQEREQLLLDVFQYIQIKGRFLPASVYWERLRTFPTIYHESLNLAPSDDGKSWEILTDLRPSDDPYYANQHGTQGGTVMMRKTLGDLFGRHEQKESLIPVSSPDEFRFCGLAATPNTKRDHAYVVVFARLLPRKPEKFQGMWIAVERLGEYPVIPSNQVYMEMARDVMLHGALPHYREFLGTD
jgi:hypothetical protein